MRLADAPLLRSPALRRVAPAFVVALAFAATLALFHSGLGPNDSDKYVRTALLWLNDGPALGDDHWSLRLPLIAPMAASYAVFGPSEAATVLPNVLYAAGLVAVTFYFARRHLGPTAGFVASLFVATSAFFVIIPSELTITGPDIFFSVLACWLFIDAGASKDLKRYAAAGLCAGGAWLCRETAIFLPLAFAALLVMRSWRDWRPLAAVSAGFGAVVSAELISYAIVAGDPLYRYLTDSGHRGPGKFYHVHAAYSSAIGRLWTPLKHLVTDPATTPMLLLAALLPLSKRFRSLIAEQRNVALVFGIAAAFAFLISGYAMNLKSPYYYPVAAYAALLALAAFAALLYDAGKIPLSASAAALVVLLSFAAADFRSYGEYAEPRRLARFIAETGESVTTDNKTAVRTRMFLRLRDFSIADARRLVSSTRKREEPLCGLVFVGSPKGAQRFIKPEPDWRLVWSDQLRPSRLTHRSLGALGVSAAASPRLAEIVKGAEPAALYRAPCD